MPVTTIIQRFFPILFGAAYYYFFHLHPHLSQYGHRKPRLKPIITALTNVLCNINLCQSATRFKPSEFYHLAYELDIDDAHHEHGNWRFSPTQRFALFLIWFANYYPSRKLSIFTGWASNSILHNALYHVHHIIEVLDVPGGGQSHCSSFHLLILHAEPLLTHLDSFSSSISFV